MSYNAANAYKKTEIETADKGKLIVMLYEGAIKFLNTAIDSIDDYKKYDLVNKNIEKTADIIEELQNSLDMSAGDIATKLDSIYEYCLRTMVEANTEKSKSKLIEVKDYLQEMLSSWKEIANSTAPKKGLGLTGGGFSLSG